MSFTNSPNEFKFLDPGISANTSGTRINAFSNVDGTNGIIIPSKQFTSRPYRQVPATLSYLTGTSSTADLTAPGVHGIGSNVVNLNSYTRPQLIVVTTAINALSTSTYYIQSMLLRSMSDQTRTYPLTFAAGGAYSSANSRYQNSWIAYYEFPVGTVESFRAEVTIAGSGTVGKYRSDIWLIQDHSSPIPYTTGTRDSGLTWDPTILNTQHNSVILANAWCNGASGIPTLTGINGPIADNAESNMIWTGYLTGQGTELSIPISAVFSAGTAVVGGWAVWR
jgi:hypothetical protein